MLPLPLLLLLGAGAFFVIRSRSAASEAGPTGSGAGAGPSGATGATGMTGFGSAEGATGATGATGSAWADAKLSDSSYGGSASAVDAAASMAAPECYDAAKALDDTTFSYISDLTLRGTNVGAVAKKLLADPTMQRPDSYAYVVKTLSDELAARLSKNPLYILSPATFAAPPSSVEGRLSALATCLSALASKKFPTFTIKPGMILKPSIGPGDVALGFGTTKK